MDLFKDFRLTAALRPRRKVELKSAVKDASDACLWLKAAGFPQYVQMFQDGLFPINLSRFQVEKDHTFLEQADLDSLVRRLNILNRCADVMDSMHASRGEDSDDDLNFRALSDKWQFRRKQKKWLRRRERNVSAPSQDTPFSSAEELSDDHTPEEENTDHPSPLMLVSELRNSLTDIDRAGVKTYSFMVSEDQMPLIQVEPPRVQRDSSNNAAKRSLLQSSVFSSFESEEDEEGYVWDSTPCAPHGGMDNFATGMMDTFESSLLKLKDFQTQSLPDVFEATKHFDDISDVSALSSASASTVSILDSTIPFDPSHGFGPSVSPLALNGHTSPKNGEQFEEHYPSSEPRRRVRSGEPSHMPGRVSSAGSYRTCGSNSPMGSEGSERELSAPSPQPVALERAKFPLASNGLVANGVDGHHHHHHHHQRQFSSEEVSSKRTSKVSVTSTTDSLRRFEAKWHSYQRPHNFRATFRPVRTMIPIEELSVGQISVLRKLSLVKLTAQLELYNPKANLSRLLKGKKQKIGDLKYKRLFGVPLAVNVRHTGQALPPLILNAMDYMRKEERMTILGLFRRAASKARVEMLREVAEDSPELLDFEDFTPNEVADLIKLYCRELPEPILTSKLSEILILIQESVPSQVRLPALQAVMLLMPDEHREALQVMLLFLREVASYSATNQMTAQNLAVCFAPTLFSVSTALHKVSSGVVRMGSFKRNTLTPGLSPHQLASTKEVTDSVVSSHCLSQMISQVDKLFKVATDMLQVCRFTHLETGDPVPYYELGLDHRGSGNLQHYVDTCVQTVLREARKKFKSWHHCDSVGDVEVSYLKPRDGVPLWVWRGTCQVKACSAFLHRRLWMDRFVWNGKIVTPKLVAKIDEQTEVFQYPTPSSPPFTERDHCLLRSWQYDAASQSYVLVATSVSHPSAGLQGGIRAMQLATSYLVEPLDSDKSRLSYICRVDMRGRSADYYNKAYGVYLASTVAGIRDACMDHSILETSV